MRLRRESLLNGLFIHQVFTKPFLDTLLWSDRYHIHKGGMGHGGPIFKEPKDEQRIYILRLGKGNPVIELRAKIP